MPPTPQSRFPSLYAATLGPLRRYLARLLGRRDDAEDLAHDAYARVYRAMHAQYIERPEAYLYTTARRLALQRIQRRTGAPVRDLVDPKIVEFTPAERPGVDRVVMAREEWARIEAAVAGLPRGCRQVLLMHKIEQLSHAEISAALGIAVSTVEKQHVRALRLLRAALQADPAARELDRLPVKSSREASS